MKTSRFLVAMAALVMCGCGAERGPATPDARCGDGVTTHADGQTLCLYEGAITETGFECPPELPFEYSGDGWKMCAEVGNLDQQALDEAVDAAGSEDDPEATETPEGPDEAAEVPVEEAPADDPPAATECVDHDQDGVCADVDMDDRDPTIGAAPA